MVNITPYLTKPASEIEPETFERMCSTVREVIRKLPKLSLITPSIREALSTNDKLACDAAEHKSFPAFLTAIRSITGRDPMIAIPLLTMFGLGNLDLALQVMAFGQIFTFECMKQFLASEHATDEIDELEKMFNDPIDNPNASCNNVDRG